MIVDQLQLNQHHDSTKKCYYTVWKLFNEFFIQLDTKPGDWADRLTLFVGYLIQQNRQSATVQSYVSAIKAVLRMNNIKITEDQYLLASLTKACKLKNDRIRMRLPIRRGMLCILLNTIQQHYDNIQQPYLAKMYPALFCTAYFGLFQVSELTSGEHAVKAADMHVGKNKHKMLFLLRSSKTHGRNMPPQQIKVTATIKTKNGVKPKSAQSCASKGLELSCPFQLLQNYIHIRGGFCTENEPFFVFSDGTPVHSWQMRKCLKLSLTLAGFEAKYYSTISLRAGHSCDLHKIGLSVESIKKLGRWHSNAIFRYLRNF